MMPLYTFFFFFFLVYLKIKCPEFGMETDLKNFITGFKIEFRIIETPHTFIIKLVSEYKNAMTNLSLTH